MPGAGVTASTPVRDGLLTAEYEARLRYFSKIPQVGDTSHLAGARLDMPLGSRTLLRLSHRYTRATLETTVVDPGREYFFDLARFTFHGFLARKGKERTATLAEIAASAHTSVLYESPARVADTLSALAEAGAGARAAVVARELTKQFEEFRRGTVDELAAYYGAHEARGEIVVVVSGAPAPTTDEESLRARAATLRAAGKTARDVTKDLMETAGAPRNLAYRIAHE